MNKTGKVWKIFFQEQVIESKINGKNREAFSSNKKRNDIFKYGTYANTKKDNVRELKANN